MAGLPLSGIRVLESAHQYPGPYCSLLLSELGAEVVKLERPGKGDPARQRPHFFNSLNCNKKSCALDLKHKAGQAAMHRLIPHFDVFSEGFRPGVARRLGIDHPTLSSLNPGLIYCSLSGYGQEGPASGLPSHDLNLLARSGMLGCLRDDQDKYIQPEVSLGDLSAGMFAALGILSALLMRRETGRGTYIDMAMFDGLLSWLTVNIGMYANNGQTRKDRDPGYGIFFTADKKALTLGIANEDWFWDRLVEVCGLQELRGIPAKERRQRKTELRSKLEPVISRKNLEQWLEIFQKADVPAAPVQSLAEMLQDPQVKSRDMIRQITLPNGEQVPQVGFPLKISGLPAQSISPPPELGEHTPLLLKEAGYTSTEVEQMRQEGII